MKLLKKSGVNKTYLKNKATAEQADLLADQLADKPYGRKKEVLEQIDEFVRTSISLPKSLLETLEDLARDNKRQGIGPKNVSAIVRESVERYMIFNKK